MLKKSAITLLTAFTCSAPAASPIASSTPDQPNPPLPVDEAGGIPNNAFQNPAAVDNPFRNLFRTTSPRYNVGTNDLRLTPEVRPAETLKIEGALDLPDFRGQFPLLQRGFAPENADLKIGPVYFKLRQLSAGVLWTDNFRRNNDRRESQTDGFVSIGAQLIWQVTEASRISASGNFVWLPWDNEAGLTGFALRSPLSFGLASAPDSRVQAAWEPVFFGIPWVIANEFRTETGRYTDGIYDSFELFEGFRLNDESGDSPRIFGFRDNNFDFRDSGKNDEFTFFGNEVSAATSARIAGDVNFRFRATHSDFWYPNNDDDRGLPSSRNTVSATLESYRESLRFKPYINYRLSDQNDPDRLYHYALAGVRGPVTDLIRFNGSVGYFFENKTENESFLWNARLDHTINPRTSHSIEWSRNVLELSDEISQHVLYRFNHVLGPGLSAELYAGYHWIDELTSTISDREDLRTGARLTWRVSPRTSVRLWGQYTEITDSLDTYDTNVWRGRFELSHRLYDAITTRLIYQRTDRDSSGRVPSYDENLIYFTMSYMFE